MNGLQCQVRFSAAQRLSLLCTTSLGVYVPRHGEPAIVLVEGGDKCRVTKSLMLSSLPTTYLLRRFTLEGAS
jgi:hypothetical protein